MLRFTKNHPPSYSTHRAFGQLWLCFTASTETQTVAAVKYQPVRGFPTTQVQARSSQQQEGWTLEGSSLVLGVLTTAFLMSFGCLWALPCSITAVVLGITVS